MRAILREDPFHGAGYGVINLMDIANMGEPCLNLVRTADGLFLGCGGWQKNRVTLPISRWQWDENSLKVWVDPAVMDNIDLSHNYKISLAGEFACPLSIASFKQSEFVNLNGQDAEAPPPDPLNTHIPVFPQAETVYSGVSETPVDEQEFAPDIIPNPDISPAGPNRAGDSSDSKTSGKKHMLLWSALAFAFWAGIGGLLWLGVKNAPIPDKTDDSETPKFEIIPRSQEGIPDIEQSK